MGWLSKLFTKGETQASAEHQKPLFSAADYCERGQKSLDAGKYVEAMEFFQAAIEADKHFEKAYILLATAYEKQGKKDKAKATLYGLLAVDPNNENALKRIDELNRKIVAPIENTSSSTAASTSTHETDNSDGSNQHAKRNNQNCTYKIFDGKPEDRFDFFILFDDGNRLFFKNNNGFLSIEAPSKSRISYDRYCLNWEGYKTPEGALIIPEAIEYKGNNYVVTTIGECAFYYCDKLNSIHIPQSVIRIENRAFYACTSLQVIQLPNNLSSIGDECFKFCTFSKIDVPDSVITIGESAFDSCKNLTYFQFPVQINYIKRGVLACCNSLKTIVIPRNVTKIANYAFGDMILGGSDNVLLKIEANNPPTIGNSLFGGLNRRTKVKVVVPTGALENYNTAQYWQLFDIVEK